MHIDFGNQILYQKQTKKTTTWTATARPTEIVWERKHKKKRIGKANSHYSHNINIDMKIKSPNERIEERQRIEEHEFENVKNSVRAHNQTKQMKHGIYLSFQYLFRSLY